MMKISHLEGWMSYQDAAGLLGISRQGLHKMVNKENQDLFREGEVKYIGDKKSMYIIKTEAMHRVMAQRARFQEEKLLVNDLDAAISGFKLTNND